MTNPLHNIKSPHSAAPPPKKKKLQKVSSVQNYTVTKNSTMQPREFVQLQTTTDLIAYKYLDPLETDLGMSKKIGCLQY